MANNKEEILVKKVANKCSVDEDFVKKSLMDNGICSAALEAMEEYALQVSDPMKKANEYARHEIGLLEKQTEGLRKENDLLEQREVLWANKRDQLEELVSGLQAENQRLRQELENVLRLKPLWSYPDNVSEEHRGEAEAIAEMESRIVTALSQEGKDTDKDFSEATDKWYRDNVASDNKASTSVASHSSSSPNSIEQEERWQLVKDFLYDCLHEKYPNVNNIIAGLKFLGLTPSNHSQIEK